ncbi:tripartite tricarboxylate transporter TctB family protein [Brevibacterium sp. BDJS002]|uniref:tripartite tricarboxylate transporter TctB family protein n=1 Tax=unclassified Brevibacterium TaxID=2614124 RepID=UPI001F31251B|nr:MULTISPECIES: tripartite tricarboxylate transporter TctB family protein [unclassified Brevibacterium]MCF2585718.1 tripartite tricarboxylate transporter TctB family protein [Brevibacterium sp. UCMA 11752]WCE40751.1 tripartite tricarboxylate transporter TctB family protein [Brevibacterium sp. BDJS002]
MTSESTLTETSYEAGAKTESTALSTGIAAVVLGAIAVFYLVNALLLPNTETDEGIGPKTFPVVVAIVLICTTALGVLTLLRGRVEVQAVSKTELLRVVICIVLFALFAASIFLIGFAEAAAIFSVLTSTFVFGVRLSLKRAAWLLVVGLVIGLVLFLVFDVWLNVLLPVGWIEYLLFGGLNL